VDVNESVRRRIFVAGAISAGTALLALPVAGTAAWGVSSEVRLLPFEFIGPLPLEPGTYQTRPTFVPRTTFTVGRGWYGGQGAHTDWGVGKGLNGRWHNAWRLGEPTAGISAHRLGLPVATAVSRFRALRTLTARPSKPVRVGGYPGVSFHAVVQGDHASLPGIERYLTVLPGGQQIFLNVRGRTLLLRIEIARKADEAAVRGVLRTVRFPR
jgi:hypothetical protein